MTAREHPSLFNWLRRISILFLIAIVLPTNYALAKNPATAPGPFDKYLPADGAENQPISLSLMWNASNGAAGYEYCIDAVDNNACDTGWISTQTTTTVNVDLSPDTVYYWQVRADRDADSSYANNDLWWSLKTGLYDPSVRNKPGKLVNPDNTDKNQAGSENLGGTNLITDPSFEASFTTTAYWYQYSFQKISGSPLCTVAYCGNGSGTAGPHSGSVWGWFGGVPGPYNEYGEMYQYVTIPACSSIATLQFYFWIGYAGPGSSTDDVFTASVDSTDVFTANATQRSSYSYYKLISVDVSAWADGSAHRIDFRGATSGQIVNFNLDDVSLVAISNCAISGNVGVAGATLSYTDGTPKTATSSDDGSYSLNLSYGWSGIVTPTHTCYTFSSLFLSYSNVTSNITGQDYTPTLKPGCANINVTIAGGQRGMYGLPSAGSTRVNYAGVNDGPAVVASSNGIPIIAAERDSWWDGMEWSSFSQLMGLPASQISDTYVFPAYNNVSLDEQIRIGNVDPTQTSVVTVTIGGHLQATYTLLPSQAVRDNYAGVNAGPVIVQGTPGVKIIAAERDSWWTGTQWTSFIQTMGLPASQISDTYVFPAYNNVSLDEQMRIGNVDPTQTSVVTVTIGGVLRGTYNLLPNQAIRDNYAGVNDGPVIVQGTAGVKIIAAERDAWYDGTQWTSFAQTMGLPSGQISNKYLFPAYNNVSLDEQMRIGNVDPTQTSVVTVTIGGVSYGTYTLLPNQAVRVNYSGVDSGPVVVQGTAGVKIIAAERDAWWTGTRWTSFVQTLGLPSSLVSTTYVFPAYNNVSLDEQLRFGVP